MKAFGRFAALASIFLFYLLPAHAAPESEPAPVGLEGGVKYTIGDWPVKGLGNVRARVSVSEKTDVVWTHVPWRRHEADPQNKDTIVIDAATGQRVTNVVRANISREAGDLLFQPPTAPGEYYIYYLPFWTAGEWYFPTTIYLTPTNTAGTAWVKARAPAVAKIRAGQPPGLAEAQLLEIQAIDDFHRFDPMEITATAAESKAFRAKYGSRPFLLFPEDRRWPIRMTDELPLRWTQAGPQESFGGEACRGEFYAFQIGIYACREDIKNVTASFEDLTGDDGAKIPGSALRCFNLAGTNWLGVPFRKTVNIAQGNVEALWFGVAVPTNIAAQAYRGTVKIGAENHPAVPVSLQLKVSNQVLADAGDSDISRQSRLRWLDSTIGLDDEVFAPYTPVALHENSVSVLGRKVRFNNSGLLESIVSTFSRNVDSADAPPRELLAAPMALVAETAAGPVAWAGAPPKITSQSSGAVSWEASNSGRSLRVECHAKMDCDGYVNYQLSLRASATSDLNDIRLEIPLRREAAVYMMGLGRKGGYRPASWDWKWDPALANNQLWLGDVDIGLNLKLKHLEDRWDLANLKQTGPYKDWSNDGRGGCTVREEGDRVVIRAYSGPRTMAAGEVLHFNFGLLITPVKVLDKAHWGWRYYHSSSSHPVPEIAATGATIINLHQGDALNPYINYPFLTTNALSAYIRDAHARNMKVKLYYTIRELSDYTGEFWPLRSLGNEVFLNGPGFQLADQFRVNKPGEALPKTGDSWLCEHVIADYVPAWHTPLGNGRIDAAIATTGLSRWHNYYLEGLGWLIRNVGIDGLYLDGVGYDREIMQRVRKVMQREGHGALIDFHSGNNFSPGYGLANSANQYMELFPCLDSLWFGEGFDYNEPPEYWLVEICGIPYGLFGEMLGGGNPWRGMLFGMSNRLGWGGDPRPIWKMWDDFGIQDAAMSGFWDPHCPAQTDRKDVLATAYVKKGKTLVSLASWATNAVRVRLAVNCDVLGLDASKISLYAPPIRSFQPEMLFKPGDEIPVSPGRGWLLLVDEQEHKLATPADFEAGKKMLFEERFAGEHLAGDWKVALSKREGTKLSQAGGAMVIEAAANTAAFAEHSLPAGTVLVSCLLDPRTDQGASWGPGLALFWTDGKALRVNARSEGRFGVDANNQQFLEGLAEPGKPCCLVIRLEENEVIVEAAEASGSWQELARFPRSKFPGDPSAVRLGKMSPAAKNEDFSSPGPAGACAITLLQVMGR